MGCGSVVRTRIGCTGNRHFTEVRIKIYYIIRGAYVFVKQAGPPLSVESSNIYIFPTIFSHGVYGRLLSYFNQIKFKLYISCL